MSRWTSGPSFSLRKYAAAVPPMPAPMMATLGCCLRQATPYQAKSSTTSWMHVAAHAALQSMPGTLSEQVRLHAKVTRIQVLLGKLNSCCLAGSDGHSTIFSYGMPCDAGLNVCALRMSSAAFAY